MATSPETAGDAAPTGELLRDGRFQLMGKLGEGSQGTTFDAIDRRDGRAVAIKRFSVKGAASWKDVELAEREAAVLESLSHPLLPAHVDHFEEGGALYLVMEKVEGRTLSSLTKNGARLSQEDVIAFLRDASTVLAYLHGRSPPVFHRDVNPKNVIRRPDGSFVLVDFGAVRDRLRPEGGSTVVGTFGYMAPEQFQGRAGPGSDVFGVGATALRLLTGVEPDKLPHKGLALDVSGALGSSVDPALRGVLERMLEPDPDKRATSLGPLVERLGRVEDRARRGRGGSPSTNDAERQGGDREHGSTTDGNRAERRREERARRSRRGSWEDWEGWNDARKWTEWADSAGRDWAREARRMRKRARRMQRRGRPLRGPPLVLALLGIQVAMWVVAMVVGVLVPLVLTLLSVVFGRPLRDAAKSTRHASFEARETMKRAQAYLLHGTPMYEADGEAEETPDESIDVPSERTRVSEPEPPPRVRVGEDGVLETTGEETHDDAGRRAR